MTTATSISQKKKEAKDAAFSQAAILHLLPAYLHNDSSDGEWHHDKQANLT